MSTKPSTESLGDNIIPADPARLSPGGLIARIQTLESELSVLRKAAGLDKSGHAGYRENLTTVKVPEQFKAPFLRAQQYVAEYFSNRIEHPDTATILIAGERYVLLRAASLSVEFVEMVTKLYQDNGEEAARSVANNLLFDLAHALGKADARSFQKKMGVGQPIDNLSAGPIHFAFSGWAFVDISAESWPSPDENYFLLYEHPYSFESHSWLAKNKKSSVPVCVMNAGYSSGWCEESFGLPLVAVEIECLAAGGDRCRFVMAPPSRIEEHVARYAQQRPVSATAAAGSHSIAVPEFFQRKRLEAELRDANDQLEQRVQRRTHELESANEQLRLLGSAVENATEGFVIMEFVDGEGPLRIIFVNQGFCRITGYTAQDVLGRSLKYLRISNDESSIFEALFKSIRRGKPFEAQLTAIGRDGVKFPCTLRLLSAACSVVGPGNTRFDRSQCRCNRTARAVSCTRARAAGGINEIDPDQSRLLIRRLRCVARSGGRMHAQWPHRRVDEAHRALTRTVSRGVAIESDRHTQRRLSVGVSPLGSVSAFWIK
jgi:PAS domain S-box-containing protein